MMEPLKVCRVCLVTNVKMFDINILSIFNAYLELTGISDVSIYPHVCFECVALLRKCNHFRSKCFTAHGILRQHFITREFLQTLDRQQRNLASPLATSTLKSNQELSIKFLTDDEKSIFDAIKTEVNDDLSENKNLLGTGSNIIKENDLNGESNLIILPDGNNISDFGEPDNYSSDDEVLKIKARRKIENKKKKAVKKKKVLKSKKKYGKKKSSKKSTKKDSDATEISDVPETIDELDANNIVESLNDVNGEEINEDIDVEQMEDIGPVKKLRSTKRAAKKSSKIDMVSSDDDNYIPDEDEDDEKPLIPRSKRIKTKKSESLLTKDGWIKKGLGGPKFDATYFDDFATVVFLTPEQAKAELELRKESNNYRKCPFKCEFCYKGYEAQSAYENHMLKHKPEYGEHECELCHLRFPKPRFLCRHMLSCHKRKFCCKICPYVCFCTTQAKTHVKLHKGKKYHCEVCGDEFSMPNSLFMHKRIKHSTEIVCALCGSTFPTERGLNSHNILVHRQDVNERKGPSCVDCGVQFSTEIAWKRHLVLSSKHSVSNGCEYCGDTFPDEDALKAHTRTHARKQFPRLDQAVKLPAACPICEKWLTTRMEYRGHMTSLHPESEEAKRVDVKDPLPCVCEICGKMFRKQCFLIYHQRKHTGERPYKCRICGKSFAFPGTLSAHKSRHNPKKGNTHKCDMCGKNFAYKSALNKHIKAHLGIRPHKCSVCDKTFPNPCDVKMHMQYVHCKVPWPKRDRSKKARVAPDQKIEPVLDYSY